MMKLNHKLTVDDLIIEYMIYKVKNDYEPQFSASEFMNFLNYFESEIKVEDVLYEKEKLFQRFFKRKCESDWSVKKGWNIYDKEIKPHMKMEYSKQDRDYIIRANYGLSFYDNSVINTYFMNELDMERIRKIIGKFLENEQKRKIDISISIDENKLIIGKYIAARIVDNIWRCYIEEKIKNNMWPKQCDDINKYLFEIDLAELIGLNSIRTYLIKFYDTISKRISILYQEDKDLKISSYEKFYLANANYRLIIKQYEEMFTIAFGENKNCLVIDLQNYKYEVKKANTVCEEYDIKNIITTSEQTKVKKLINNLSVDIGGEK